MTPDTVTNGNYLVNFILTSGGNKLLSVSAHVPDSFHTTFGAKLGSPLALLNHIDNVISESAGALTGHQIGNQLSTGLVYSAPTAPSFSFPLIFDAEKDAYTDVVVPVATLIAMSLPEQTSTFGIQVPGPTIVGVLAKDIQNSLSKLNIDSSIADNFLNLTMYYGSFMKLSPCAITSVDITVDSRFDTRGNPIRIECNVTVEPFFTPYKNNFNTPGTNYSKVQLDLKFGA